MESDHRDYLFLTMHDFKTNLARYLRQIERGEYLGIVLKRYNSYVAYVQVMPGRKSSGKTKSRVD